MKNIEEKENRKKEREDNRESRKTSHSIIIT
jgi:hypothetical protein